MGGRAFLTQVTPAGAPRTPRDREPLEVQPDAGGRRGGQEAMQGYQSVSESGARVREVGRFPRTQRHSSK